MNLLQILKIKQIFVFLLISYLFLDGFSSLAQKRTYTVVLDAGHGGKDPGKVGYKKYKEKDIALEIVLEVGKRLLKEKDVKVIYTRKKDVFVDLFERGRIANKAHADLFVSVHCNAHNSQAAGSETWVLGLHANKRNFEVAKAENEVILLEENYQEKYRGFDPNSPESVIGLTLEQEENLDKSISLASAVQNNFKGSLKRVDRGVKQAGFIVLHQTYMPSILVETGFLTNKREGAYLNSKKGKLEMASSISKAIINYVNGLKMNTVVTIEAPKIVEMKSRTSSNKEEVLFKIQIASGKSKISTASYNFKGLKEVKRVKVGSYYKYYLGETNSYSKAKKYLISAKKKGYTSAFIAAFRGGEKISLSEAIK
ncbi:N-acetylmuramoyl-L-alanine amidase family protein [Flavicella sediminum]|uniref:N-acetylmuramoyl-L-alanine amidase family protein n=1 Tax=Flavicella sediminum TaxID=2585141 RepID=UPI001120E62A|nr:N-acetylmuramoyl-L-alanine amidase [Flavicella sediminum]